MRRERDQVRLSRRERERSALQAEVARLTHLVLEAEARGCKCGPAAENTGCPWCRAQLQYNPDSKPGESGYLPLDHDADCPAFSGPGVVREGPVE